MNRAHVLLVMPWVASAKYARWLAMLLVGIAAVAALAFAVTGESRTHREAFILALGFAVWALWSSYLGANLQLARNARDLCLPRMQRDADLSLLLFALLSVTVPTALCWMFGAAPLLAAAVFLAAAALGFAYMLLPLWIGLPLVMAAVLATLGHGLSVSISTWWGLAVLLTAFDVFRWWQLRTAATVQREGMRAAAVFYCYRPDAMANGGWYGFGQRFLQARITVPLHADLRRIGPRHIVDSMRFALGGFGMPKPFASRLQDVARLLAFVWVYVLLGLLAPLLTSPDPTGNFAIHWLSPLLTFGSVLTCCAAVNAFAGRTRSLWRKTDAELPLLALLPGLGDAASGRRDMAIALLAPPAVFLACTCAVLSVAALALHTTPWAYLALALCAAGALALIVAVTLASMCGRPMHTIEYVLLYAAQLVLSMLLLIKAMPTDRYHGAHPEQLGVIPAWLLVLWSIYLLVLAVLAVHGARELRKRPHAFLASGP